MMKRAIYCFSMMLVLLLAACTDPKEMRQVRFNATLEQPKGDDKVHLVNEQWIYWDVHDFISVAGDQDNSASIGELIDYGSSEDFMDFNGIFITELAYNSKYFVGLYPHSESNVIDGHAGSSTFDAVKINFPKNHSYTNDSTFGQNVLPMVAWYGGEWDEGSAPFNLNFHSLAGLVRFQIYNAGTESKTVKEIRISCKDTQLCGLFNVLEYKTYDPYVADADGVVGTDSIISIKPASPLAFGPNTLLTFYVPLPVIESAGETTTTRYRLGVQVISGSDEVSSIRCRVPVRRNSIAYMKSLAIGTTWTDKPTTSVSGCGTSTRPFKVYDVADLQAVRDAYNSVERRINGQELTENTYIRIMRSDIVLTDANWTAGIDNFVGHMDYYATNASLPGITNTSSKPIFNKIGTDTEKGTVTGITVRTSVTKTLTSSYYSPFCNETSAKGSIIDCHVSSHLPDEDGEGEINVKGCDMAGLCYINRGLMQGCGALAHFSTEGQKVAGICAINFGTIKGCYTSSTMSITGASRASGICDNNTPNSIVQDCYFAARITGAVIPWAAIVHHNQGTVSHCYASESGTILSNNRVGGIVGDNSTGGSVDRCWCSMPVQGDTVGLIAYKQISSNASITNCFVNAPLTNATVVGNNGIGGGIVGYMTNGLVRNCYVYLHQITTSGTSTDIGGIVGKHEPTLAGGTVGKVSTCYCYQPGVVTPRFYGSTTEAAKFTTCYCVNGSLTQTGVTNQALSVANMTSMTEALETARLAADLGDLQWNYNSATMTVPNLVEPSKKR